MRVFYVRYGVYVCLCIDGCMNGCMDGRMGGCKELVSGFMHKMGGLDGFMTVSYHCHHRRRSSLSFIVIVVVHQPFIHLGSAFKKTNSMMSS